MEYGRTLPRLHVDGDGVEFRGGPVRLSCTGPLSWQSEVGAATAMFGVAAGDTVELGLTYSPSFGHGKRFRDR